jgi:hypothetical protein
MSKTKLVKSFEYIIKEATEMGGIWNNKQKAFFHYLNPNGLVASKRKLDDKIKEMVDNNIVPSGWYLAYGGLNSYRYDDWARLAAHDYKRVTSIELRIAIESSEEELVRIQKKIDDRMAEYEKEQALLEVVGWTEDKLNNLTHAALVDMMKSYKVIGRSKITKKGLMVKSIWATMPLTDKAKPKQKEKEHFDLNRDVENFKANGGEVKQCRPQRTPKRIPPTMSSAEKSDRPHKKSKYVRKDGDPKPRTSRVKRVREDENIVTLQSVLNEVGLKGSLARKALRSSGIQKPGKQWCWPKDSKDLESVRNLMEIAAGISNSIKNSKNK